MAPGDRPPVHGPTAANDPVVVDLDAPEADADRPPTGRPPRIRTLVVGAVLVGVLALGVFLGRLNAGNAAANTLRVFTGDLVVNVFSTDNERWHGSLTVINDGEQPIEVHGLDVPGFDLAMIAESVTVAPGERTAADLTLSPDCADLPGGTASPADTNDEDTEDQPLTLSVATAEDEHTIETPVAIGPDRALAMLHAECTRSTFGAVSAVLEVDTIDDARPHESLRSRASLTLRGANVAGEVTGMRSLMPGYTLTTDALPTSVGSSASTTLVDITWSVDDCDLAMATDTIRNGPHIGATVRTETDGERTDTAVQGAVSGAVVLQLGLLAASSCPT